MRTGVHCSDSAPTASPAQAITTPTAILYLYVNHILRISILITSPCLLYTGFNAPHAIIPHCSAKKQNKSLNKSLHVTGSAHKKHRLRSAASKTAKPEPVWSSQAAATSLQDDQTGHSDPPASSFTTSSNTFAPATASSSRVYSFGLWLIPPMLGTKIIAVGQILASIWAS